MNENSAKLIRLSYVEDFEFVWESTEVLRNRLLIPLLIAAMVVPIAVGVIQALEQHDPRWWVPLPIMIPFCFGMWFLFCSSAGRRWQLRRRLRGLLTSPPAQIAWEFDDSGVIFKSSTGTETRFPWSAFEGVQAKSTGILLIKNRFTKFWFPVRTFANLADFKEFSNFCRSYGVKVKTK